MNLKIIMYTFIIHFMLAFIRNTAKFQKNRNCQILFHVDLKNIPVINSADRSPELEQILPDSKAQRTEPAP